MRVPCKKQQCIYKYINQQRPGQQNGYHIANGEPDPKKPPHLRCSWRVASLEQTMLWHCVAEIWTLACSIYIFVYHICIDYRYIFCFMASFSSTCFASKAHHPKNSALSPKTNYFYGILRSSILRILHKPWMKLETGDTSLPWRWTAVSIRYQLSRHHTHRAVKSSKFSLRCKVLIDNHSSC